MSRLIAALMASALALPAAAQGQIVPDTAAALTTNTQTGANGPVTFIGGGQLRGGNLFHSFSFFNVGQGQAAVWVGPQQGGAAVANVINRVTGGSQSIIQGELASIGLPNANFYLLNPAGVFFGPGAVVNLPNAVHFSAAQELRFADGARFSAVTPSGSTFTSAAPQAFGFLGGQGNVTVGGLGAAQFAPQGARLHLSGGNVGIFDSGFATRGLDMIAVGSGSAAVSLADPLQANATGQVLLGNSGVTILSGGGRPGLLRVSAGLVEIDGGFVVIQSAPGLIGSAQIKSGIVSLVGGAELGTVSAAAAGGPIAINAGQLLVAQQSRIFSQAYGASPGGAILIGAADLFVGAGASIESATMAGSAGSGGAIAITADRVRLANGIVGSLARSSGDSGAVMVQARSVDINFGKISSATLAGGNAGAVSVVTTESIALSNGGGVESAATVSATGAAGPVTVQSGSIAMSNRAFIDASSASAGRGGEIKVTAARLDMAGGSSVSAATAGSGAAGAVDLDVGQLTLASESFISASSVGGTGAGGTIRLRGDRLALTGDSFIQTATVGAGAGGSVDIAMDDVLIDGSTVNSSTGGGANAGNISIVADTLAIVNGGIVTSFSAGAGTAGAIRLAADSITLASGATLGTFSAGTGAGGDLDIEGGRIRIDASFVQAGSGFSVATAPDGSIRLIPGAANAGPGGAIRISGSDIELLNRAAVSTDTLGGGRAGDISVSADSLRLSGQSGLTASTSASGQAGQIRLVVDTLDVDTGSGVLSVTNGTGDAGGIVVDASERLSLDRGALSSVSSPGATGASGSVSVKAPLVELRNDSGLLTDSNNIRTAGIILVRAGNLLVEDSAIASTNRSANGGAAGAIRIEAEQISLVEGGAVLTDALTGPAGDIEILMPMDGILRLESRGAPTGISTSSGPGTGGRITIASPYLILSNGGAILALGEQGGANVQISSDFFIRSSDRINLVSVDGSLVLDSQVGDPSTGTEAQDVSFLDASSVLRGQCAGIRAGGTSAFTSRVTGPYAPLAPTPVENGGGGSPTAAPTTAGSCS